VADARDVVSAVQAMLLSSGQVSAAELTDLADQYGRLCRQVNQRLQRCKLYLDQGLVGEAIADLECAPDLLEQVEGLCFEERADWEALCDGNGLSAPAIEEEIASELNEAYTDLDPVKDLLRQQRVRVLQQVGVAPRARLIQQLEQRASQPIWGEFLAEHLRLAGQELVEQSAAAAMSQDLARIEQIVAQMRALGIQPHLAQFQQVESKRVQVAGHKLVETHREGDLPAARNLRDAYFARLENGDAAAAQEGLQAALDWVAAEDRRDAADAEFDQACRALQDELGQGGERERLEECAQRIESMRRELPESLHDDYVAALQAIRKREQRRLLSRVGLLAAGVMLLAVGGAFGLRHHREKQATRQWVDSITGALEAKEFERARQLLDEVSSKHPKLGRKAGIRRLEVSYQKRLTANQARVARLEDALARARGLLEADQLIAARKKLSLAAVLASRESEKSVVEQLSQWIREARAGKQGRIDQELRQLNVRFSSLPGGQVATAERLTKLLELRKRVTRLLDDRELPRESRKQATLLLVKIQRAVDAVEQKLSRLTEARNFLSRIGIVGKDCEQLEARLKSFIKRYPAHPSTRQFKRALRQAPQWRAIVAWNEVASSDPMKFPVSASSLAGYLKQHGQAYNQAVVRRYQTWCRDRAFTLDGLADKRLGLGGVLDHWLLKLRYIETRRGTRYYFRMASQLKAFARNGEKVLRYKITYQVSTLDPSKTKSIVLRPEELAWTEARPAPCSRFRDRALALLNKLRLDPVMQGRWELIYRDLARLVLAEKQMHSVLQVTLLDAISRLAATYGSGLRSHYKKLNLQLKDVDTEDNWVSPSGKTDRVTLRGNMTGLDKLLEILDEKYFARMRSAIFGKQARRAYTRYQAAGVLLPTDVGQRLAPAPRVGVELYALVNDVGWWQLVHIGRAGDAGAVQPLARQRPALPHGTQLFVKAARR